jgi:HlyD family secretion protein
VQAGSVTVQVSLEGPLPRGARPALSVIGSIEVERIADVLHVARPAHVQPDAVARLFRSSADGSRAEAVDVRVGRASANTMEIVAGLIEGDEVILSDMSMHDEHDVVEFE